THYCMFLQERDAPVNVTGNQMTTSLSTHASASPPEFHISRGASAVSSHTKQKPALF
ncbi:hypothetical protein BgiBS90_017670, partial [Biomphalaria glabrata]